MSLDDRFLHVFEPGPALEHHGGRLVGAALGHEHQLETHVVDVLVERGFIAVVETEEAHEDPGRKGDAHQGQNAPDPLPEQIFVRYLKFGDHF